MGVSSLDIIDVSAKIARHSISFGLGLFLDLASSMSNVALGASVSVGGMRGRDERRLMGWLVTCVCEYGIYVRLSVQMQIFRIRTLYFALSSTHPLL